MIEESKECEIEFQKKEKVVYKYYIEIQETNRPYIKICSKYFNTEEDSIQWAKNIQTLDNEFSMRLMIVQCDYTYGIECYGKHKVVRYLEKELKL